MITQDELVENFPQPLTQAQRSRIERQTLRLMRQRKAIGQKCAILESQLTGAKDALQRALARQADLLSGSSSSTSVPAVPEKPSSSMPVKRPRDEDAPATDDGQHGTTAAAPQPQRRAINLRKSAAFGALQSFLTSAVKESSDQLELTKRREEIGRQTQLAQLRTDVEGLGRTVESLTAQLAAAKEPWSKADQQWRTYSSVLERLEAAEAAYCSSFFLRAHGDDFDIFFSPAMHTEESKDMVAAQVEVALDEYLEFRAQVDPLLLELVDEEAPAGASNPSGGDAPSLDKAPGSSVGSSLLPPPSSGGSAVAAPAVAIDCLLPKPFSELDDFDDC